MPSSVGRRRDGQGQAAYALAVQQLRTTAETYSALAEAFPSLLAGEVPAVLAVMPKPRHPPMSPFTVEVAAETVAIPYRIHHDEPPAGVERSLTATQRLMLHCLYSRHSDGWVRQRHLEQVVGSGEPWAAPFVVQLVGEYVLEILKSIRCGLLGLATPGSAQWLQYGDFVARNPAFFMRTERRVVGYWSCYHRHRYTVFGTYPGCLLLESLRAAAADRSATSWPRHTPPPLAGPEPRTRKYGRHPA